MWNAKRVYRRNEFTCIPERDARRERREIDDEQHGGGNRR
jgi:hypothetical protein